MSAEEAAKEAAPVADLAAQEAAIQAPVLPIVCFKLESKDNQIFEISEEALKQSSTLSNLVINLDYSADKDPITVNNVLGAHLKLVVEWCEHHKGEPIPSHDDDTSRQVDIPEWDKGFLELDNDTLFQLVCAANYLDVKGLLIVSCKTVANMANGKSPEQLRLIFGITENEDDGPSTSGSS